MLHASMAGRDRTTHPHLETSAVLAVDAKPPGPLLEPDGSSELNLGDFRSRMLVGEQQDHVISLALLVAQPDETQLQVL